VKHGVNITTLDTPLGEQKDFSITRVALKSRGDGVSGKAVTDDQIVRAVKGQVELVNQELANYEQIKQVTVLAREFSIESGEMTPTLKMKRNVIEANYKDIIDGMY
jgi:long-chain acyl-CoA synthetase